MQIDFQAALLNAKPLEPQPVAAEGEGETFQQVLAKASSESNKLADAAKQFEALIMGQILKTARESSDGGWLGTGDDQTGQLALEMAEQEFARALSSRGDLGIAKLVTTNLERNPVRPANSGTPHLNPLAPAGTDSAR